MVILDLEVLLELGRDDLPLQLGVITKDDERVCWEVEVQGPIGREMKFDGACERQFGERAFKRDVALSSKYEKGELGRGRTIAGLGCLPELLRSIA